MAGPKIADRVKETSTTTGTGTLNLAGAVSGFQTFVAGIGDANTCLFSIVHQSAAEWEVSLGTVSDASPDTLSRTTVLASSNSNNAVNFSAGTKDVFSDWPAGILTYLNPTATVANLAAYQAGRIGFPSDGMLLYRDSGTALVPWGPLYPFTAPVSGDFAWVNQGGASVDTTYGGVALTAPAQGSADNCRIRKKAAPSTPYTITAYINYPVCLNVSSGFGLGLCFRQSSDGKLVLFINQQGSIGVRKYTNETTFSADYITFAQAFHSPWFRLADNGTNRICSTSTDGQHWTAIHTVGRTDYITADEVGFFANAYDAGKLPGDLNINLLSWKEA